MRLSGDTVREANTDEVTGLKRENGDLKQAVAELYLRNDWLKKQKIEQSLLVLKEEQSMDITLVIGVKKEIIGTYPNLKEVVMHL